MGRMMPMIGSGLGMGMQGMPAAAGGSRLGVPQLPGDSVYRPSLDFLTGGSQVSTPPETQFTDIETFSLEGSGLSPIREAPTEREPVVGNHGVSAWKSKKKGKGKGVVGESSQAGGEGEAGYGRRSVWSPEECVAVAKAWINVCEDPIRSNNQTIDRMWARISESYETFKSRGAKYEEIRKQWEQIKADVSRFSGIYDNNTRSMTSSMTMEDVKRLPFQQFPEPRKFGQFKYWDAYVELMESSKFRARVDAGWPKRTRLNLSSEYSSSIGSHDHPDEAEEASPPVLRRRRPVGQKMAMRMFRRASSGSPEVQSAAPSTEPSAALTHLARMQAQRNLFEVIQEWNAATDPRHKDFLESLIHDMRRDLGITPPAGGAAGDGQGDSEE